MEEQINKVRTFHETFEIPILESPKIPSLERCSLRQNILQEEVDELRLAWKTDNITEVADAIIDCMYILIGTAHEFGLQDRLIDCFNEVHRSNMSKLDENGKILRRDDGKIAKSKLYSPPNLKEIVCNQ